MLGKRYHNNGKSRLVLNDVQIEQRNRILKHITTGNYVFEDISCSICGKTNFHSLSEKDRYGIYLPIAICRHCGLVQATPRMLEESYNHFYNDGHRKLYVGREHPDEKYLQGRYKAGKDTFEFLSNHLEIKGKRILEVGCGSGAILKYLHDHGASVKGIDLSREYLEYGKMKYQLDLEHINLFDLPDDHKFDLIIYSDVLEHVLHPKTHLKKIKTLLKKGGILYIKVPGVKHSQKAYQADFLKSLQNAHVYYFTATTLRNLLSCCGYSKIYSDETVRSLWKISEDSNAPIINDYTNCMDYLEHLEKKYFLRNVYHIAALTLHWRSTMRNLKNH